MGRYILALAMLGLVVLALGLWALGGRGGQAVEAQVLQGAKRALAEAGVSREDAISLRVSGRDIHVAGLASNPGGAAAVRAALDGVAGRGMVHADLLQDLPLAAPYVLVAQKQGAKPGAVQISGVVPSAAMRAQLAARFGAAALGGVTLAAGAPAGWQDLTHGALSGLAVLHQGKITIEGQMVIVTGAVLTAADLAHLQAVLAGVPLRVMDVAVLDDGQPVAFQLRYSPEGGAQVQGKLPPGASLAAMAKALRLPSLSGAPSLAQVGAPQDMAYLATWGAVLPQLQDMVADVAPGARFLRAKLQPGGDAAAVKAALSTGGFTVTLTAPPPPKPTLVALPPPRPPPPPDPLPQPLPEPAPQPQQPPVLVVLPPPRLPGPDPLPMPVAQPDPLPAPPTKLTLALPRLPMPDFAALVPRKSALGFDLSVSGCQAASNAMLAQQSLLFLPYLDRLNDSAQPLLADLTALARDCLGAGLVVEIGGHSDTSGKADENLELSARRAEAIRASLVAAGLPADQIAAKGYGAAQPITENATKEGRAKNRRIGLVWADGPVADD